MFRHKHPAFKALRDTVAFLVLCVALQGYVARTDGAEAAAGVRHLQCHGHGLAGKPAPRKRK